MYHFIYLIIYFYIDFATHVNSGVNLTHTILKITNPNEISAKAILKEKKTI